MKTHFLSLGILLTIASSLLFFSCKKEALGEDNAEEVITTMVLTFTPQSGGNSLQYQFDDPDGPGGNDPVKEAIVLSPGTSYLVSLQLLNKTSNPVEDITLEVKEEAQAHRFYLEPSANSNIVVSNLDNDDAGLPLGINSTWQTGAAATGTIKITLRHYPGYPPDKAAGDLVDSPKSSTDVEIEFDTKVQ